MKQARVIGATMDPLTVDEAVVMLKHLEGVAEPLARELYRVWGGSLRHLIAAARGESQNFVNLREQAFIASGMNLQQGISNERLYEFVMKRGEAGRFIIHDWRVDPENPVSTTFRPASEYVSRKLHESFQRRGKNELGFYFLNA